MAGSDKPVVEKQIPYCTLILVGATIFCHSLVLSGNLATSAAMADIGKSTHGWSTVGLQLSDSFTDVDGLLQTTSEKFTNVLLTISNLLVQIDSFISDVGNSTEEAMIQVQTNVGQENFTSLLSFSGASHDKLPELREKVPKAALFIQQANPVAPAGKQFKQYCEYSTCRFECQGACTHCNEPHYYEWNQYENCPAGKKNDGSVACCYEEGLKLVEQAEGKPEALQSKTLSGTEEISIEEVRQVIGEAVDKLISEKMSIIGAVTSGKDNLTIGIDDIKMLVPTVADLENLLHDVFTTQLASLNTKGQKIQPWVVQEVLRAYIASALLKIADALIQKTIAPTVDSMLALMKPALQQIGQWLVSFGDAIQATMESVSTSIDRIQKIFDQFMQAADGGGKGRDQILYDTFTIFDATHKGSISVGDLENVTELFGLDALYGGKAETLHKKYDLDNDGELNEEEYASFVDDPEFPDGMSFVLRKYAKAQSEISGVVAQAVMRDEVAEAVVGYLQIVCAKNLTKVSWIAERLINASVPMAFTADVLATLAFEKDNPDALTNLDIGQIVVDYMFEMNASYTGQSLQLMSDPSFWVSEGYDPTDQEAAVEQVTEWVVSSAETAKAEKQTSFSPMALLAEIAERAGTTSLANGSISDAKLESMSREMVHLVRERSKRFRAERRAERASKLHQLYSTKASQSLRSKLLGGSAASSAIDTLLEQAINSGQPAVPATLEFTQFLSWNATQTADTFQEECFNYSGTSSNALDSFSDEIKSMVKSVQTFLDQMEEYSTPKGVARVEDTLDDFLAKLSGQTISVVMEGAVDPVLDKVFSQIPHANLLQAARFRHDLHTGGKQHEVDEAIDAAIDKMLDLCATLITILPDVVNNLKNARTKVSGLTETLKSIFTIFDAKGPPIFEAIASYYSEIWIAYFVLFAIINVGVLFYGFWASGWCGGPKAPDEDYEAPQTCYERMCCCCNAIASCVSGSACPMFTFWSLVCLSEIIVLVLFILAIVLCLLAGVKAFVTAGCSQLYILNDESICAGSFDVVKQFLDTFWPEALGDFGKACQEETLLTCAVIGEKLANSTLAITVGSTLAAVLTFQLIVESAVMHERARWTRLALQHDAENAKKGE